MIDLLKLVAKIRQINSELALIGALLIRHDERQSVCKLIDVEITNNTKIKQSAIAQMSLHALDKTSKVSRAFKEIPAIPLNLMDV
ncbi:MAG: hypothetical protein NTW85_01105 [Methylococcales bacterium]|nr:hypothetical protein [Methylococcales bacterium]